MITSNPIILIRHFPTLDEIEDKVSATVSTLPILEESSREIDNLSKQLKLFIERIPIKNIYTSDSFQAFQTGTLLGEATGLHVIKTPLLRNIKRPLWEGLTNAEIRKKFPEEFDMWCKRPGDISFIDGENINMVRKRIIDFSLRNPEPKIIITHTTTFHSFLLENFNLNSNKAWDFKPEMFCFTVLYNKTLWGLNTRNLDYLTMEYK